MPSKKAASALTVTLSPVRTARSGTSSASFQAGFAMGPTRSVLLATSVLPTREVTTYSPGGRSLNDRFAR